MIFGDSNFAQLIGHPKVAKQFHAAAIGDVHLRVRGRRRVSFHQHRRHTVLRQRQCERESDWTAAGDQHRNLLRV